MMTSTPPETMPNPTLLAKTHAIASRVSAPIIPQTPHFKLSHYPIPAQPDISPGEIRFSRKCVGNRSRMSACLILFSKASLHVGHAPYADPA
jgi:hypothetical protein